MYFFSSPSPAWAVVVARPQRELVLVAPGPPRRGQREPVAALLHDGVGQPVGDALWRAEGVVAPLPEAVADSLAGDAGGGGEEEGGEGHKDQSLENNEQKKDYYAYIS